MWIFAFLGSGELLMIIIIILILFGATRLPQLGDALGRGIKNFKDAISGEEEKKAVAIPAKDEKKSIESLPSPQTSRAQGEKATEKETEKIEQN